MARPSPRFQRRRELDELRRRLMREQVTAQSGDAKTIADLRAQVVTLNARRPAVRVKAEAVPSIGLGGSMDVVVTWTTPLPAAAGGLYDVDVAVAPALLGKAEWVVKSRSPTGVVLTMTPIGLSISLGQWLIATGVY